MTHVYRWRNNAFRAEQLCGRPCVVEARGRMNTVLVRFTDGLRPERVTTSRYAVRPIDQAELRLW